MIRANDPVTMAEIAAVVGLAEGEVYDFGNGALAPDGDRMPLRRALGLVLLIQFSVTEALSAANAVTVAVTAAEGVADGGTHSLLIGWEGFRPFIRWAEPGGDDPLLDAALHVPVMMVPADTMLADLGEAVARMRDHNRQGMH